MLMLIGAILVLASVVAGFVWEGGKVPALIQPAELLIIGGSAVGSVLISTPTKVLMGMLRQLKGAMGSGTSKAEYISLLSMLYQLFKVIQQAGVMALESHFEDPPNSPIMAKFPGFLARQDAVDFLADSVKVIIVGGIAPHDLESLMDEDCDVHQEEAMLPSSTLTKVGDSLPGLGIVAAVLGVVITMASIDGPPAEIGEKVGAALVGTFLGILLCYGFVGPLGSKLEHVVTEEGHYLKCMKTGILAVYKGFPPAIAVEFARRVIPGDSRPTFDETEQACKARPEKEAAAAA
ncbi:MAG TPA: flagellar motor stator protein MotA [Vicinamibacterales bacterium]|jgi:chemotaxis protein MotA